MKPILTLKEKVKIKGMNHITGGGFYENIPRGLPNGLAAKIDTQSFPTPKYLNGYNNKLTLKRVKCITFLIWA